MINNMAYLLALTLKTNIITLNERRNTLQKSINTITQQLNAQTLLDNNISHSVLLTRQTITLNNSIHTRSNLLETLLKTPTAISTMHLKHNQLLTFTLNPNNHTLTTIDNKNELTFVNTTSQQAIPPSYTALNQDFKPNANINNIQFNPNGSKITVDSNAPTIVNARTHQQLTTLYVSPNQIIHSIHFSPNKQNLFAILNNFPYLTPTIKIQHLNITNNQPLGPTHRIATQPNPMSLMITHNKQQIIVTNSHSNTTILNTHALQPLQHLPINTNQTALSTNNRTLLLNKHNNSMRFYNLNTNKLRQTNGHHTSTITTATFTPNNHRTITNSLNNQTTI